MGLAALMAAFDRSGGSLKGAYKQLTMDEVARKEYIRANMRRPYEDTIEEMGEGRGMLALLESPPPPSITLVAVIIIYSAIYAFD